MKLILIIALLLAITFANQETMIEEISENAFDQVTNLQDKIKAVNCVVQSTEEVKEIITLAKNISAGKVIASVKNVISLIQRFFKMLDNCSVLFCYGPTYQKCEDKHQQGCEMNGLIVYPKCAEGYTNWGCCVCTSICPEGFTDNGLYCLKPKSYGRGAGYVLWKKNKCFEKNPQGCEKNGALWYPKCKPGFHNVGCCVCSPNCPSGWTDIGISCKKPSSYGRGVGYPVSFGMQCLKHHADQPALKMSEDEFEACGNLQVEISLLQIVVEEKLEYAEQNPEAQQDGFMEQLKQLGEKIEQFAEQCPEYGAPQEIEEEQQEVEQQ